jgi:type IV pilus assembly protein PilF
MNRFAHIAAGKDNLLPTVLFRLSLAGLVILLLGGCAGGQSADEPSESRKAAEFNTSLGLEYMNRGQYEIALGKLKKAVRENPDYAPAHTVLAVLYERIGEDELAGRHYREALEADPGDGDVNNNYGQYLCKKGNGDKAVEHFMKALDDPFYSSPQVALTNAGTCRMGDGDLAAAEDYLRRALRLVADFPDALIAMAGLNYEQQKYLSARAFLQRFEAAATHDATSLVLGYRIERALGDEKAAASYRRALETGFAGSEQAAEIRRVPGK